MRKTKKKRRWDKSEEEEEKEKEGDEGGGGGGRAGWTEGAGLGEQGKLIIQLVCRDARREEVMRATKGRPPPPTLPPLPSPRTTPTPTSPPAASCCALMSALFRQHVCRRHEPETNPLFDPPLPPLRLPPPPSLPLALPPSITPSSLHTAHLCCAWLKGTHR